MGDFDQAKKSKLSWERIVFPFGTIDTVLLPSIILSFFGRRLHGRAVLVVRVLSCIACTGAV